ncbi:uncharacterized protein LOC112003371 isoform X6 [Quercus suber]|uniref:uncharacterized protein LOC112003371 isoform X6 n=1 Tax=Quercus suber TaxID=58331 RepID=UPI0032DF64FC
MPPTIFREERYRSNANGFSSTNKRQQSNGINRGRGDIGMHDSRMSPNDLRLKLINKRKMKRIPRVFEERRKMDQSQKLSKTIQPARHNMQQQRSELEGRTFLWRTPATERPRSPNRNLKSSRGLSPQGNFNELHQVPPLRAANNSRARWFLSYDGASRQDL